MNSIDILLPPLLLGWLLALISGPLGSFVVWGRMSYFGDTLAHSSLLGITLSLLLKLNPMIGVISVTLMVALILAYSQRQQQLGSDTILGIIAHCSLALGLLLTSLLDNYRIDLMGFLFGDLLAVTWQDLYWVLLVSLLLAGLVLVFWRPLVNMLVNPQIARAEGVPIEKMRLLLMVMLAMLVAIGMKMVGALLITAMIIIPAASAQRLSRSPQQMALLASALGSIAVVTGIALSYYADTATGPSIVTCACGLYIGCSLKKSRANQTN